MKADQDHVPTVAKFRRIDFYPDDWITGTQRLSLEERGAYITVCALIYSTCNRLDDDDRHLAAACGVDVRVWRRLKSRLVSLRKLTVEDGFLRNGRCTSEATSAELRVLSSRQAARIGGIKSAAARKALKDLHQAGAQAGAQAKPSPSYPVSKDTGVFTPTVNPKVVIFDQCLAYLKANGVKDKHARSLLGRWRCDHGEGMVIEVIAEAGRQSVSEPVAWIEAALKARAKGNTGRRQDDGWL